MRRDARPDRQRGGRAAALVGPRNREAARAQIAVAGAAVLALGYGVWQARRAARVPPPPPLPATPWHAMPVPAVLAALRTTERGLAEDEARRRARRRTTARRRIAAPAIVRAVAAELANPMAPVLSVGAIGSAMLGSLADTVLIGLVMGSSALVGGVQRVAVERTVARMAVRGTVVATVRRDGRERQIDAAELVPGDVIVLRSGDLVPADCRIIAADGLETDESALTGESLPVAKTDRPVPAAQVADRRSMVYEGTVIAAGEGEAVVVAVGELTETGRALAAAAGHAPVTGVEARLAAITRATTPVALGAALASALSGVLRGLPLRTSLETAISLAVAAVPEGLPLLVSAAQLAATRRLATRGVYARDPRTIEALGRVNVLCFDKTGTLTEGGMRLTHVADERHTRPLAELDEPLRRVLTVALRATPGVADDENHPHLTDAAVDEGAAEAGVDRGDWERLVEIPFEPSRGFHAALGRTGDRILVCVKGAPEVVLPRCRAGRDGELDVARVEAEVERLAATGHRVLAVAEGEIHVSAAELAELTGEGGQERAAALLADGAAGDLTFTGLLGLADVVRDAAAPAIARLTAAGVQIVMLTGDHPSTAGAIAAHVTGRDVGHHILTGTQIDELSDEELDRLLPTVDVVARCTPAHKVRVVESFQRIGRVVAMTGDGANDAAGIRLADVGIALGGGTRAAQAAADLVVADDRLETIISALVEGRAMWASVREALAILVGGNLGEIAFTLVGALATGRAPLSARQLLLVNLLTDLAPALAIAVRAPSEDVAASAARGGAGDLARAGAHPGHRHPRRGHRARRDPRLGRGAAHRARGPRPHRRPGGAGRHPARADARGRGPGPGRAWSRARLGGAAHRGGAAATGEPVLRLRPARPARPGSPRCPRSPPPWLRRACCPGCCGGCSPACTRTTPGPAVPRGAAGHRGGSGGGPARGRVLTPRVRARGAGHEARAAASSSDTRRFHSRLADCQPSSSTPRRQ